MSQRLHLNATYKYSYPVGAGTHLIVSTCRGLYACVSLTGPRLLGGAEGVAPRG